MGLHRDFQKKWDIYNPVVNVRVGAWTLAKKVKRYGSVQAVLKKYNTAYTPAYGKAVMQVYRQYRRQNR